MFIGVICIVMMGVSRRMGDLLLNLISVSLCWAFTQDGTKENLTLRQKSILDQIPHTLATSMSRFHLDNETLNGQTTTYAVCPQCHAIYRPKFSPGSNTPTYPTDCDNRPDPESECSAKLLNDNKPIKTYVYHSFHDYLAGILSRKDLEDMMDDSCDDLMASIQGEHPNDHVTDAFQADFIRTFEGPQAGRLFVDRPQNEGRYLFAFNFDFFAVDRNTVRGASASCGVISAACLNIPLSIRYKPENMYIAGIIPGPGEPHNVEINHYFDPIVDDLSDSWERGVHFSRTANYPNGRDTRSAIALGACDLPGGRKFSQCADHGSHHFCTVCDCYGRSTLGRVDFADWKIRDQEDIRQKAENWKNASTKREQEDLFTDHGMRWSPLWRLPYWNPARMLVVDPMHCLLEGLAKFHFRDILNLTWKEAEEKAADIPAFEYEFEHPDDRYIAENNLDEEDLKQISSIHKRLVTPLLSYGDPNDAATQALEDLTKSLNYKKVKPLVFVCQSVGAEPVDDPEKFRKARRLRKQIRHGRITKDRYVEGLVNWVSFNTLQSFDVLLTDTSS